MAQLGQKFKMDFFFLFAIDCSFTSILVQNLLILDIAFSRYGNFIYDFITDQLEVDFEKV